MVVFVANLFYLQYVFARLPVMVSWATSARTESLMKGANLLVYMGMILGRPADVGRRQRRGSFSELSDVGGPLTILLVVLFIVFAGVAWLLGEPSATAFTAAT